MTDRDTITLASVAALLLVIVLTIVGSILLDLLNAQREEEDN